MIILIQSIEDQSDRSKFELIYKEYCGMMYHVANKILNHHQDAEDAVHFAFEKIVEIISLIQDPVCPRTRNLVITIARNKARDILRKNNLRQGVPLFECDMAEEFTLSQGPTSLSEILRNLPELQQDVLFLKYIYGFSLREIANLLGISLKYAQQLDCRGKSRLKNALLEEDL